MGNIFSSRRYIHLKDTRWYLMSYLQETFKKDLLYTCKWSHYNVLEICNFNPKHVYILQIVWIWLTVLVKMQTCLYAEVTSPAQVLPQCIKGVQASAPTKWRPGNPTTRGSEPPETTEHRTFLCMEVGSLSRTLVPPWDWYDTVMLKKSVPWRERKPMFSCCSWRVVNERYTYLTMVIFESYTSSLTPITNIGASADGAVMMTFLQPPSMCSLAFSSVVKTPVDSITYSTPTLPQGILFGSFLSLTQTRTGHSRENV